METPNYIKSLLKQNGRKPAGRRVWSIDLETVWLPFFLSTNVMGESAIPHDALGAPLRLAYNPDGGVKFSKTGKPVIRVAKDLSDAIRLVRENFTAGLMAYSNGVVTENPEGYKAQVTMAREAGEPIVTRDNTNIAEYLSEQAAAREHELDQLDADIRAEAKAEAEAEKPKRKRKPKTEPTDTELKAIEAEADRELVTA